MDINEQKNLATSYNLATRTTNELIQLLQKSIKSKFGIYSKADKDKLMLDWFISELERLKSLGMEQKKAQRQAAEYAKALFNQLASSVRNVPRYHIWTIEKEIDDIVSKINYQNNKNECLYIKLFTFESKNSTIKEYKSLLNTIESTKSTIVLLIKNFAKAKGELFEWLRYDVKNRAVKNCQTIITTPLVSDGQTQSLIGIGVLQTVLISE